MAHEVYIVHDARPTVGAREGGVFTRGVQRERGQRGALSKSDHRERRHIDLEKGAREGSSGTLLIGDLKPTGASHAPVPDGWLQVVYIAGL